MPRAVVITGPSGVGKGTLIRSLREQMPELELSVSATTRRPRTGETQGVDYHFMTDEEFERHVADGDFVEHADYAGARYGTLRSELETRMASGAPVAPRDRGPGRAPGARDDARGDPGLHRPAVARRAARPARRPWRPTRPSRSRLDSTAERELAAQDEFARVVVNDRLEDAVAELVRAVRSATG